MRMFWIDSSGTPQEIEFDAVESEKHGLSSEATTHPVEGGAAIADHVVRGPRVLSLAARVSDHPIRAPRSGSGAQGAVGALDLGTREAQRLVRPADGRRGAEWGTEAVRVSPAVLQFPEAFSRVADTWVVFRDLVGSGLLVTVESRLETVDNLNVDSVTVPRSAADGSAPVFEVELSQIRAVNSRTVSAPEPREERGRRRTDRGRQEPAEAGEGTATRSRSLLSQLLSGGDE